MAEGQKFFNQSQKLKNKYIKLPERKNFASEVSS